MNWNLVFSVGGIITGIATVGTGISTGDTTVIMSGFGIILASLVGGKKGK
jgi:hypothetical protein